MAGDGGDGDDGEGAEEVIGHSNLGKGLPKNLILTFL